LIDAGIDLQLKDFSGKTVLKVCEEKGRTDLTKIIEAAGGY
jgi:hypothetical protein